MPDHFGFDIHRISDINPIAINMKLAADLYNVVIIFKEIRKFIEQKSLPGKEDRFFKSIVPKNCFNFRILERFF